MHENIQVKRFYEFTLAGKTVSFGVFYTPTLTVLPTKVNAKKC